MTTFLLLPPSGYSIRGNEDCHDDVGKMIYVIDMTC